MSSWAWAIIAGCFEMAFDMRDVLCVFLDIIFHSTATAEILSHKHASNRSRNGSHAQKYVEDAMHTSNLNPACFASENIGNRSGCLPPGIEVGDPQSWVCLFHPGSVLFVGFDVSRGGLLPFAQKGMGPHWRRMLTIIT